MDNQYTKNDTDVSKGIAVCLLLAHHLFIEHPEMGMKVFGYTIAYQIAILSKVCVAIFAILSGYGLNERYKPNLKTLRVFYGERFVKIFINYWFMWVVFVPVGIIFFDRNIKTVYGSYPILKLILNIFGVHYYFGILGYNMTWWYMSVLVALYLMFPFIRGLIHRYGIYGLFLTGLTLIVSVNPIPDRFSIQFVMEYIFPFTLGVYLSENNGLLKLRDLYKDHQATKMAIYFVLFCVIIVQRKYGLLINGTRIDGIFGLLIIMIGYEYFSKIHWLKNSLTILGQHLFNIFLFHTFIFYYYFPGFIYGFKYPVVIFVVLLGVCLVISILLEKFKGLLRMGKVEEILFGHTGNLTIVREKH